MTIYDQTVNIFSCSSLLIIFVFTYFNLRSALQEEIEFVLDLLEKHVSRLREMSPLWEMVQEGIDLKEIQWTQDAHAH